MHSTGAQPSANGHREAAVAQCVWYDRGWEQETQRLRSLEAEFDPGTCRLLDSLGVVDGWHCLEVGAGAGSIARWMAERTAPGGRVIAVDLDLRHMNSARFGNLETRALDIVVDDIGEAVFDLVHARAVLEHIPARQAALRRIVSALKPGGWLLVEDFDLGAAMAAALTPHMPADPDLCKRMMSAIAALFTAAIYLFNLMVFAEFSPFHHYFLYHVRLGNFLSRLNFLAFFAGVLANGNLHEPQMAVVGVVLFAQWFAISWVISKIVFRIVEIAKGH